MSSAKIAVAGIAFLNEAGELLMHLRDDKPELPFAGHWDIIGGQVEGLENAEEAARREAFEEIGEAEIGPLRHFGTYESPTVRIDVFTTRLDKRAGDLILGEGQALAFLSRAKLHGLKLVPWTRRLIDDLAREGLLH